jgi:hypothetical protein
MLGTRPTIKTEPGAETPDSKRFEHTIDNEAGIVDYPSSRAGACSEN